MFYRKFQLDQEMRKVDGLVKENLDFMVRIIRTSAKKISDFTDMSAADIENHISRTAYDLAERFFYSNRIAITKRDGRYYALYKGKYYSVEKDGIIESIADVFFPVKELPENPDKDEVRKYRDNEIMRASLKAAMVVRYLLDYEF